MTKLEMTIRQVSDLREFYLKIQTAKKTRNRKAGRIRRCSRPAKPAAER